MGTQPNTNPDHRLFARPVPGADGSDWVLEVVDDGGRPPSPARGQSDADRPAAAPGGDPGFAAGDAGVRETGGPRFNPYFCAAWVVVAGMLGAGLVWLFGSLQLDLYGVNSQAMTRESMVMVNFQMMGPNLLPFGLAGAIALLTVQAVDFRNTRRN